MFSVGWMSQAQGFGFPKLLKRKKRVLSILFRNLPFTRTNGLTDFSRMARPKSEQNLHHWQSVQRWRHWFRDVQELTESIENMNAKSLSYWLCKFVQEVANKSGGRYPSRTLYNIVCGLKHFLVEKNGAGALNPLVVSDKRYHWKS